MRIEDVNIDHMRRKEVVTVEDGHKTITSIPVGFVYEKMAVSDANLFRWHDKETCPDIVNPTRNAWQSYYNYGLLGEYTFTRCFGGCVPNQKIIPWNTERFVHAMYSFIHIGYKVKRTVKFANGEEVWHYEEAKNDSGN